MSLRNLVKRDLVSCPSMTTVKEVAELMQERNVGAVVVTSDDKPVGIITDRDIVTRCIAEDRNVDETAVEEIMTDSVETVGLDDGIFDIAQLMKEHKVRRVPIVDDNGIAVGLVSFGDVFSLIGKEMASLMEPLIPEEPKITNKAA